MSDVLGCDIGNAFGYVSVLQDAREDAKPLLPSVLAEGGGMPTTAYVTPPSGEPICQQQSKSRDAVWKSDNPIPQTVPMPSRYV